MNGGRSSPRMRLSRCATVSGMLSAAIGDGSSRRLSTSTSSPGYAGASTS
jgi:hypothetical protein